LHAIWGVKPVAVLATAAAVAGGTGTALVGTTEYARPSAPVVVRVRTPANTRCVTVSGAHTARSTSAVTRSTWSFTFGASGTGTRAMTARSFSDTRCTLRLGSAALSYVVDSTAPRTTAAVVAGVLTLTATDTGSGVASTSYAIDGGSAQPYTGPVTLPAGQHTVTYRSSDRVGNIESTGTLTATGAVATSASMLGLAMTGPLTIVTDATTTAGRSVTTTGTISAPAGVSTGTYLLTARVRGTQRRVHLNIDGREVYEGAVGSAWSTVSAPVYIAGPTNAVGIDAPNVDTVTLTPADATMTVAGNQILDTSGTPVTLRGVNRNGFDYNSGPLYWGGWNDVAAMGDWGASIVRIQMSDDYWLPTSCMYDPNYASQLDSEITMIHAKNMVALLDLHTSPAGTSCAGGPQRQKMADAGAIDFWKSVAARYKNLPYVAFDLFNEPHDISQAIWRNGGTVDGWQAAGMQQMYDAVRSTGATNLVFVSGLDWAYTVTPALATPIDGYGIVYSPHVYYNGACGGMDPSADSVWGPVAAQHPIVISEFGSPCPDGGYVSAVISYAESHGYGWIAYVWADHANGGDYGILSDMSSHAPNAQGAPVQAALWRAKGWTTLGGR
jgi:hypothetical protein